MWRSMNMAENTEVYFIWTLGNNTDGLEEKAYLQTD